MYNTHSNNKEVLIIKIKTLKLNISSVFLLVIVVDKEVLKTKTSFLAIPDIKLNNNSFCHSYNM